MTTATIITHRFLKSLTHKYTIIARLSISLRNTTNLSLNNTASTPSTTAPFFSNLATDIASATHHTRHASSVSIVVGVEWGCVVDAASADDAGRLPFYGRIVCFACALDGRVAFLVEGKGRCGGDGAAGVVARRKGIVGCVLSCGAGEVVRLLLLLLLWVASE